MSENKTYVFELVAPTNAGGAESALFVSIVDDGGYYTSENVEGALQEVGATNASQDALISANAGNIATNTADIATNAGAISTNTANITTNTTDIATNAGDIATLLARGLQEVLGVNNTATADMVLNSILTNLQYKSPYQKLTSVSNAVTWDLSQGQTAYIELTESTTITLSNKDATNIVLYVSQDSTGGHNITFNTADFGEVETSQITTSADTLTLYVLVRTPFDSLTAGMDGKYRGTGKTFAS